MVVFAGLAFVLLFFSPFGPIINNAPIPSPFHPIGWAGIFIYLAMLICYSQKYEQTKDAFWLILVIVFLPNLISDLYFFPTPKIMGQGMAEWMAIKYALSFICLSYFSKNKLLKYSNLLLLLLFPIVTLAYFIPIFGSLSGIFVALSIIVWVVVIGVSLGYHALQRKEYLLLIGIILTFIVAAPLPAIYVPTGMLPFGWSQLFMGVLTDRIAVFGRILMLFSLPALTTALTKLQTTKQK